MVILDSICCLLAPSMAAASRQSVGIELSPPRHISITIGVCCHTSTRIRAQNAVLASPKNATLEIVGRHDPAIIRRICIVVNSLLAVVVCDLLTQAYGKDYLKY